MTRYAPKLPVGIGEETDGFSNIFRFGCFEFVCPDEITECSKTCGFPVSIERKKAVAEDNRTIFFITESNIGDFPEIKNKKYNLNEGFCSEQPKLGSREISIKGIVAGCKNYEEVLFDMKQKLSCLKDKLYLKMGCINLYTEAEITDISIEQENFEITFCTQPYFCDDTESTLDEIEVFNDNNCFEVKNGFAPTYPNLIITVKGDKGENLEFSCGETKGTIFSEFNIGDVIYIEGESNTVTVNDEPVYHNICFEPFCSKEPKEICLQFGEFVIDPDEDGGIICSQFPYTQGQEGVYSDDTDFCEEIDVSSMDYLQHISINARDQFVVPSGNALYVRLDIFTDAAKTNGIFNDTQTIGPATGNVNTSPGCGFYPMDLGGLDVTGYDTLYFNYSFVLLNQQNLAINIGNNGVTFVDGIRILHNKIQDNCTCISNGLCFGYPQGYSIASPSDNQIYGQTSPVGKRYMTELCVPISKNGGLGPMGEDLTINLTIYPNSSKNSILATQSVTLFAGLQYEKMCFKFDPAIDFSNLTSAYFEFEFDYSVGNDSINEIILFVGEGTNNGMGQDGSVYFEMQCSDDIPDIEVFSIDEYCVDYQHKNRYV